MGPCNSQVVSSIYLDWEKPLPLELTPAFALGECCWQVDVDGDTPVARCQVPEFVPWFAVVVGHLVPRPLVASAR